MEGTCSKPRCPLAKGVVVDICETTDKRCNLECGLECETYNDFLAKADADYDIAHHNLVETGI